MKQLYGKNVFDSIEEMTAPQHTALVVIDMQNDYGHTAGKFASSGKTSRILRTLFLEFRNLWRARAPLGYLLHG